MRNDMRTKYTKEDIINIFSSDNLETEYNKIKKEFPELTKTKFIELFIDVVDEEEIEGAHREKRQAQKDILIRDGLENACRFDEDDSDSHISLMSLRNHAYEIASNSSTFRTRGNLSNDIRKRKRNVKSKKGIIDFAIRDTEKTSSYKRE